MSIEPTISEIKISVCLDVDEYECCEDLFSPFTHLITGTRTILETSTIGPHIIFGFRVLPTQKEIDELLVAVKEASTSLTMKLNECKEGHQPDVRPYNLGAGQVCGFHVIDSMCGHFGERFDTREEAIIDWNANNPIQEGE